MSSIKLIDFIHLATSQKEKVLTWRNHQDVRKWMLNQKKIPLETHLNFIKTLSESITDKYFLVIDEDCEIGVIYFNRIDILQCEIGLYLNPDYIKSGRGSIVLQTALSYAFENMCLEYVTLEVFCENILAINLYKKFAFQEINKRFIENKCLLKMELKNENWTH